MFTASLADPRAWSGHLRTSRCRQDPTRGSVPRDRRRSGPSRRSCDGDGGRSEHAVGRLGAPASTGPRGRAMRLGRGRRRRPSGVARGRDERTAGVVRRRPARARPDVGRTDRPARRCRSRLLGGDRADIRGGASRSGIALAPRRVQRIDLGDLDRAAVDTLLHLVLRGPVEATTASEVWTASEGNVLFVRELVLGAIDGGRLSDQRGVWRLTGPLVATPRLHELVADRLGALDAEARAALDVLAIWEPTGLAVVESVVRRETLEALDRSGLLAVRADGRRATGDPLASALRRDRARSDARAPPGGACFSNMPITSTRTAAAVAGPNPRCTARLEATGTADRRAAAEGSAPRPLRA